MDRILARPTAALFPAVCLLAALLGRSDAVFRLVLFYFVLEGFTLCAADAFRNAAAREPGVKRVDRRFGGALMQILIGCGLFALGTRYILKSGDTMYLLDDVFPIAASALLVIIEHLFEERMFAVGRRIDGILLSVLSNLLLFTGLCISSGNDCILIVLTGLVVLIALITSLFVAPFRSFSLIPRNYGFAPKAVVQTLLYPAVAAALMNILEIDLPHALAGWILWRLARTVCRRSQDESRPMNLFLIAVCALAVILSAILPLSDAYAVSCLTALVCACVVFLAPSMRLYAGTALLLAGKALCYCLFLPAGVRLVLVYGCCILAAAINLKNALRRKVRA